ncbi:MAG: PTS lactose/cellobiose transporter subunit IIA [Lactobacillales bacterium]|nr:PTS lactose/cellobiose transporter subunit IIA [Lactobacillales bacterium]
MDGLELVAFNIISSVGSAKSLVMESMMNARSGKFVEAKENIKQANELLIQGEKAHFEVITQEAKKKNIGLSLLFIHAEDQLMSTVTLRDIATEMLEMNQQHFELKEKVEELLEK